MLDKFPPMVPRHRHPAGYDSTLPSIGKVRAERITIQGDLLCYSEEEEEERVGVYVGEAPVTVHNNYFELQILNMGANGAVSIGLSTQKYPLHKLPGWAPESIGYHADDGRLYNARATGVAFGPKCSPGDRMGCGVKFDQVSENSDQQSNTVPVFFTKNGKEIGVCITTVPLTGFYPCIGLFGAGDAVRLIPYHLWPPEEDTHMSVDTSEEDWLRLHHIRLNGQLLEYCGRGRSPVDVGLAQAKLPLNTTSHYFELEIINPGRYCYITIGLTRKDYPGHRHPGWNGGSIAYHADDGRIFEGNTVGVPFGPRCKKGDLMGCGILFPRDYTPNSYPGSCGISEGGSMEDEDYEEEEESPEGHGYINLIFPYPMAPNQLVSPTISPLNPPDPYNSEEEEEIHNDDSRGALSDCERANDEEEDDDQGFLDSLLHKQTSTKVQVFFTHNGNMIGRREARLPRGGFYPSISMASGNECVRVDLHPLSG